MELVVGAAHNYSLSFFGTAHNYSLFIFLEGIPQKCPEMLQHVVGDNSGNMYIEK